MTVPQEAIFQEDSTFHHYLEYEVATTAADAAIVTALAGALSATGTEIRVVVAFGAELWRRLMPGEVPEGLASFAGLAGVAAAELPASQRDLLFWVHGARLDVVLDGALAIDRALAGVARLALDERGFTYHDSRDLTGFIDGTANPKGAAAPSS
jgi:putative iron-dependent peroxidase